ncbi:hypothetical protein VULLAG_LOCUS3110 [Vulpes lagopus]
MSPAGDTSEKRLHIHVLKFRSRGVTVVRPQTAVARREPGMETTVLAGGVTAPCLGPVRVTPRGDRGLAGVNKDLEAGPVQAGPGGVPRCPYTRGVSLTMGQGRRLLR